MEFAPKLPVPVFPLPEIVLFPHAVIPLHVFELRYRTLVRDAVRGERLIAMALLKPGWEHDYHGSPEFFPLGCLARIQDVEWLPDDCYNLKVAGVTRVRFERVVREYPYRAATVSLLRQEPFSEDDPLIQLERRALLETCERLEKLHHVMAATPSSGIVARADLRFEPLVNALCMMPFIEAEERLALLEMDSVLERSRRVREQLERRLRQQLKGQSEGGESN